MDALRAALIASVIGGLLGLAPAAVAKDFVVTKRGDPAPRACKPKDCSLREAVIAANKRPGADRIILPRARTYNLRIANTGSSGEDASREGDLDVTGPLTILHPGKGRATVDANGIDRAFDVLPGAPTTFRKLVVRGGDQPSGTNSFGGGIRAAAKVTVVGSRIVANHAIDDGGGIAFPTQKGSLVLRRSVVARNVSDDDGGGLSFNERGSGRLVIERSKFIGNRASDWGGGFITAVTAKITQSTFAGNVALGGTGGGGSIEEPENSIVRDSTFSGNSAWRGGGLSVSSESDGTRILNSTFAGNRSQTDGGGLLLSDSTVALNAITVARNSAEGSGGGIFNVGTTRIRNSLIALNAATSGGPDCAENAFTSLGNNLLSSLADCSGFDHQRDLVRPNPKLGKLRSNGGPTQTIALLKGSPAIGKAHRPSAPARDQRGRKRDRKPDIGAFERLSR